VATTDRPTAESALDTLHRVGVSFAILHGFAPGSDPNSDVDVVVDRHPREVLALSRQEWAKEGLRPIAFWRYDIGGAAAIFLATPDASRGVQLDLLYDPKGAGKYRVRSSLLLETSHLRDGWPRVSEQASLIYLWQKRIAKGQAERLVELAEQLARHDAEEMDRLAVELTGRALGRREAGRMVAGIRTTWAHMTRIGERLRHPAGYWAHCEDSEVAHEVAWRFRRILVGSWVSPVPWGAGAQLLWLCRLRFATMRPLLVLSTGELPRRWDPDLTVTGTDVAAAAESITAGMAGRLA
jgi:hypothetical protein